MLLPIWVGAYEANAIALEIEKIAPQRPMTHDLLRNLISEMGVEVKRIIITDLRDNTFFAVIEMITSNGESILLDSRPSDAIALALRVDSPIFVNADIIKASSADRGDGDAEIDNDNEEWPDLIGEAGDLPM
jgi:bifunctional DNase/RNase